MNRTELIAEIAAKAEVSKKDAEKALNAFIAAATEALKSGDKFKEEFVVQQVLRYIELV